MQHRGCFLLQAIRPQHTVPDSSFVLPWTVICYHVASSDPVSYNLQDMLMCFSRYASGCWLAVRGRSDEALSSWSGVSANTAWCNNKRSKGSAGRVLIRIWGERGQSDTEQLNEALKECFMKILSVFTHTHVALNRMLLYFLWTVKGEFLKKKYAEYVVWMNDCLTWGNISKWSD